MKRTLPIIIALLIVMLCFCGCDSGKETTVTGMVMSVEGTVISLVEMDSAQENGGQNRPPQGQMPQRPEGSEDFTMPEDFDPEDFQGGRPEGFNPEDFDGTMPTMPEGFQGGKPEDFDPENFDGTMPTRPEGEDRPFNREDLETTSIDLANAHISVEIDGGKATGSMSDITVGTFVTVTLNKKGEATNVLVSASFGFSGFGGFGGGFGGFGGGFGKGNGTAA